MSEPREIQVVSLIGPGRPSGNARVTNDWRAGLEKAAEPDSRHPAGQDLAQPRPTSADSGSETGSGGTSVPHYGVTGSEGGVPADESTALPSDEGDSDQPPLESDITPPME